MSKISKVIFVQDEKEVMSNKINLSAPKLVEKIDLPEKKTNSKSELRPLFWKNFPISEFPFYLKIAQQANKDLGIPFCITLSKKAYVSGELDANLGSIWFTCGSKDFKEKFRIPLEVALCSSGFREFLLKDIRKASPGFKFNILFVSDDGEVEMIECIKIAGKENGARIIYESAGYRYEMDYSDISDFGSGRLDDEKFQFYLPANVENV